MKHFCSGTVTTAPPARRTRSGLALPALGLLLLAASDARAAVFDFTPLNGTVSAVYVGGSSGNVQLSISGANPVNVPSGSTQNITINNGIAAWSDSAKVYYYVFDPALNQWKGESATGNTFDLSVVDGVVAWSASGPNARASCRVYDPSRRSWMAGGVNGAIVNAAILNQGGVVAWNTTTAVHYQAYDPTRSGWMPGSTALPAGKSTFDLTTGDGVVAWSVSTGTTTATVTCAVYDPQTGQWVTEANNNNATTSLAISDALVTWSTGAGNFFRGYDGPSRRWRSNAPVPVAFFAVSTNAGDRPLVHFIDMSLGATTWSWNFGDGGSSGQRSPTHKYSTFGRFTASLSVNGNASSTNRTILTDITLPTGAIAINGAASGGFTTNRNVTLTLTATDNSGVTGMRLNNDNGEWSAWEAFATTRAWALNTNNGNRSVSAQFRDAALNTSATVTATIQLDTSPLPVISVVSTNISENIGALTVAATLDRAYSRPVVVSYTTSNGTATAGQDFENKTGTLTFPVGIRNLTIPLAIQQDALVELNETFSVQFTAISNVVAGTPGQITIVDDDLATVSFSRPEYSETESNGVAAISVRLNAASGRTITVRYEATNGTATADVDYTPVWGELTFMPGITNQVFIVPLINDPLDEFPETVNLTLLSADNAVLSAATNATLTILDDDKPVIFFSQATYPVYESNGASAVKISVRLSKPYGVPVFVECEVAGVTASGGDDFDQPASNIQLNFQPDSGSGSTNKDITLIVRPDTLPEAQETIRLTLTSFAGGSPGPVTTAHIVITDNDAPPFMQNPVLSTNGQFSATFIGFPGQVFALERSSNFIQWTEVVRLTNTTGTLNFSQAIPPTPGGQFFRTRLIP